MEGTKANGEWMRLLSFLNYGNPCAMSPRGGCCLSGGRRRAGAVVGASQAFEMPKGHKQLA